MARLALFSSCSRLSRQALESSPSAVVLAELSGSILYATEKVRRWFGYTPNEILGRSILKLLPEMCDLLAQGAPAWSGPSDGSQPAKPTSDDATPRLYRRVRCKDGREVCSNVTVIALSESRGPMLLATLGAPHPRGNSEGFQSERLDAILKTASGLAHESRNALQRAVASLDLLELDLKSNPRHLELTHKIRQSLADLLDNYDEVRRFAEPIYLNRTEQRLAPLAAGAFDRALRNYEATHPEVKQRSKRAFRLQIAAGSESQDQVRVDAEKISCVFNHLFENAIQSSNLYSPVRFECGMETRNGQQVTSFRVTDCGPGFSEEALRCAFEPFYTTRQSGTGLGLSICRRIIDAHGGVLSLGNRPSGGAIVECCLPRSETA